MTIPVPILQTCFSRSWGGLEIQALEVAAQVGKRGYPVVLACSSSSRLASEAMARSLEVAEFPVTGYFHPGAIWNLSRYIRSKAFRIIHCQHSRDLSVVVPAADLSRVSPKIILSKRVGSYVGKRDLFHRYTYSRVSLVLAISEVIRRNVLDTTPMAPGRVLTLHDAIDAEEYSPARGDGALVREGFGFTRNFSGPLQRLSVNGRLCVSSWPAKQAPAKRRMSGKSGPCARRWDSTAR